MLRVLIVDDHEPFRRPLAFLLAREPGIAVVGHAGTLAEAAPLLAEADAVVVEGRDIGTVVLPGATLKIYLTAAPEVRAERRAGQLGISDPVEIADLAEDLRRRDEYDSSRADSPLRPAADAIVVDSTGLDREAVIERVLDLARTAVGEPA